MIGNLRIGCFEAKILRKGLNELIDDRNVNSESDVTASEYEHALVLKSRLTKMIKSKDC